MKKLAILDFNQAQVIVQDLPAELQEAQAEKVEEYIEETLGIKLTNCEWMTVDLDVEIR